MKKILLIGGGGYIGAVVAKYFLSLGLGVRVLDKLLYDNEFSIRNLKKNKNFNFINGDLCNLEDIQESIIDISDVIILAGIVGDPLSKKYPKETVEINYNGIKSCLNFFKNKNLKKVIFISTCSNYGLTNNDELVDESFSLNPLSIYAKTKVDIEKFILDNNKDFDFSPIILRFATAFGLSPRMRFDLTINQFTNDLIKNNQIDVYDPDTWRPYCHVNDFATVLFKLLNLEDDTLRNQVFNVGSNENNFTKRQIVELISKKMKKKCIIKYTGDGPDKRDYKINFNKINKFIDHKMVSVSDGVDEIIECVNKKQFEDTYTNKNKYGNFKINR